MTPRTDLAGWLRERPNVLDATNVAVEIDGISYVAARYRIRVDPPAGSRAALEHRAPALEDRYYVLGDRPPCHVRQRCCFVLDGDPCEWYVGGWATRKVADDPALAQFHPMGPWFGLHRWTLPEAVDEAAIRAGFSPYARIPLKVYEYDSDDTALAVAGDALEVLDAVLEHFGELIEEDEPDAIYREAHDLSSARRDAVVRRYEKLRDTPTG